MIAVIGGTGRIGRYVAQELAARKVPARIITRDRDRAVGLLGKDLSLVYGDLSDAPSLAAALKGAQSALLLLSPAPNNPNQLEHGQAFLRVAAEARVRHVVYLSSFLPDTACVLDRNRIHATLIEELKASKLSWTVLRANYVFQNLIRFYAEEVRVLGSLSVNEDESAAKIAMIDARDIAAAAIACLMTRDHEECEYSLTGPEDVTFKQCTAEIADAIGKKVLYVVRERVEYMKLLASRNLSDSMIRGMAVTARQFREGRFAGATDAVLALTGRQAIPLKQFARDFASYFQG